MQLEILVQYKTNLFNTCSRSYPPGRPLDDPGPRVDGLAAPFGSEVPLVTTDPTAKSAIPAGSLTPRTMLEPATEAELPPPELMFIALSEPTKNFPGSPESSGVPRKK
jgi:hypothetical protein